MDRRRLLILAAVLPSIALAAQAGPVYIDTGTPSGSCSASVSSPRVRMASNGVRYCCAAGTWQPCSGVSYETVTATGSTTAIPLRDWVQTVTSTAQGASAYKATGGTADRTDKDRWADVVNVKDFGAKGDGSTDDTAAIQAAIDYAAGTRSNGVIFPAGAYKYTTALDLKSNIMIQGSGRHFGTSLVPTGCAAFRIDGADKVGGWVFRIKIRDLLVQATNASNSAPLITMRSAYNVDVENVFFYDSPVAATLFQGVNDIVFRDVIAYGSNSNVAPNGMFDADGASTYGPVSIKFYNPDVESVSRGFHTAGTANVDIVSPYIERTLVGLNHEATAGQVNVLGGLISSINGYTVSVGGDNLLIDGTDLAPTTGAGPPGRGINFASNLSPYRNVKFRSVARFSDPEFVSTAPSIGGVNLLAFDSDRSFVRYQGRSRLDIPTKQIASGAATDLLEFKGLDFARVRVDVMMGSGSQWIIERFEFLIAASTYVSNVSATPVMVMGGMSIAGALTVGSDVKFTITPTFTGGGTHPFYIDAEIIDWQPTAGGVAAVYLL